MKPKTIIRRNAEGKIIQVESIVEHDEERDRSGGFNILDEVWGKAFIAFMCLCGALFVWLAVKLAYDVGYEYGQDHFLKMVNNHQVERGMPELSFETLYHQHRRFSFERD